MPDRPVERKHAAGNEETDRETLVRRLVYYAAERTLMAWVRAALGLMALGFVIDRFGLILRQAMPEAGARYYPKLFSFWTGTALVVLGTLMAVASAVRFWRFSAAYHRSGSTRPRHGIVVGVVFSLVLAVIGAVIAVYLIVATD